MENPASEGSGEAAERLIVGSGSAKFEGASAAAGGAGAAWGVPFVDAAPSLPVVSSPAGAARVEAVRAAAGVLAAALEGLDYGGLRDDDLLALTGAIEGVGRLADGGRVASAAEIATRSRSSLGGEGLAWKRGCRTGQDLIARVTLVSGRETRRRMALGEFTAPRPGVGQLAPPLFPVVADALTAGRLGVDTAEAITAGLGEIAARVGADDLARAERSLVATATGEVTAETDGLPGAGLTHSADLIRGQVQVWKTRLDQDGALPGDVQPEARSNVGFGALRGGLYPLRGGVTPEFRGILDGLFNTHLSARSKAVPAFPTIAEQEEYQARVDAGELIPGAEENLDTRTGGEKRADILRMVLEAVARDPGTPTMGGAAPTVLVHVNAADLDAGRGAGWSDGVDAPVPLSTVEQMICAGGYQQIIFGEGGDILHLGGTKRCFTSSQRKALAARDGGCIIPGCTVPPMWTEVHHVIPWRHGGKTDIDNAVLLCWYHHHTIDTSGWDIRIVNGQPEIRPPHWIDPTRTWHPTQRHRADQTPDRPPDRPPRRRRPTTSSAPTTPARQHA
jgi:hypothetical protein